MDGDVIDQDAVDAAIVEESKALAEKRRPVHGDLMAAPTRQATVAQAFAGLMPATIGEAMLLSRHLANSRAIPWSVRSGGADTVLTIIMAGVELGLSPIRAINSISIISGNMTMKADLQLALARASSLLSYHDEGYEVRGKTDTSLKQRIVDGLKLFLLQKNMGAVDAKERADLEGGLVADQILAAVAEVPADKPYGWCIVRRGGDRLRPRVFTWNDADRVKLPKKKQRGGGQDDDDQDDQQPDENRTLANQHQYKNWPQQMYPRRARGHILAIEFGDVLMNMQPAENLDHGQDGRVVVDAEVVSSGAAAPAGAMEPAALIDEIAVKDPELADRIVTAFNELQIPTAKQLHHLMTYRGQPDKLHDWCRDEYARRRGAEQAPPKGTGTGAKKKPESKTRATKGASHPEMKPAAPVADGVTASTGQSGTVGEHATSGNAVEQPEPVKPEAAKPATTLADRMKAAVRKPGGSF